MSHQSEDLLLSHAEERPTPARPAPSRLAPEAASKIASEMHRWGRMTGVLSTIVLVIWVVLGALPSPGPGPVAVRSSLLWPGVALAIIAATGLLGGFRFDYLAGHKRLVGGLVIRTGKATALATTGRPRTAELVSERLLPSSGVPRRGPTRTYANVRMIRV